MVAPVRAFRIHPSDADFDEHARDLAELDVVRARKAWLPTDSSERRILDAREAHVRRRIRAWVDRFTSTDPADRARPSGPSASMAFRRPDSGWEGGATSR
jgi:hypothetical protein